MKNVNTKLELPQFSIFNINVRLNKVRENRRGNQENLTTFGTQDTRQSKKKQKTQHNMCWVSYKKQELFTLREHVSSPPVFGGVHVAHRFIFCYPIVRLYVLNYVL
jgi:starvation-inducible outer membrane lipoprotein